MKIIKKFKCFWIAILLFPHCAFGQTELVDSLLISFTKNKELIKSGDHQNAINGGYLLLRKVVGLPDTSSVKKEDIYLDVLSLAYLRMGQTDSSLFYANKAFDIFLKKHGESHKRIADYYLLIGRMHNANKEYEKSIEIKQKALGLTMDLIGENSDEAIAIHKSMAVTYLNKLDFIESSNQYKMAIDKILTSKDSTDERVLQYLDLMATNNYYTGEYEKAIVLKQAVIENSKKRYGRKSKEYATALSQKGLVIYAMGDLKKALRIYEKALGVVEEINEKDDFSLIYIYGNAANVYSELERHIEAMICFEKCIEIFKINDALKRSEIMGVYSDMSITYDKMGDGEKAFEFIKKALDLSKELYLPTDFSSIVIHLNMGVRCADIQDYESAIVYYDYVLENGSGLMDNPVVWLAMMNKGKTLLSLKKYDEAEDFIKKSVDFMELKFPNGHEYLAESYINYARVLEKKGALEKAIIFHEKAIDNYGKVYGAFSHEAFKAYCNLSMIYTLSGDKEQALKTLELAERCTEKNVDNYDSQLKLLTQRGGVHLSSGEIDEALAYFRQAFSAKNKKGKYIDFNFYKTISDLYGGHAKALLEKYDRTNDETYVDTVLNNSESALELVSAVKKKIFSNSKINVIENANHLFGNGIRSCYLLFENDEKKYSQKALQFFEQNKSLSLFRAAMSSKAYSFAGVPDSLVEREKEIKLNIAYFEKLKHNVNPNDLAHDDSIAQFYDENISSLKLEQLDLNGKLEKKYPSFFELMNGAAVPNLSDLQKELKNDETLIEYFMGDSSLFALAVNSNSADLKEITLDFSMVEKIEDMRKGMLECHLLNPDEQSDELLKFYNNLYVTVAFDLYEKLIAPLGPLPKNLIIVPDGILGYIPFEILLKEKPTNPADFNSYKWLGKEHTISYNYSATLWQEMKNKKSKGKGVLAIAPSFNENDNLIAEATPSDFRRNNLGPLAWNDVEVKNITNLTGGQMLIGDSATTEAFNDLAQRSAILHLATHAKLDDRNSDFSYLAFSGVNDSTDAGKIYIRDLYNMQLPLDMVVLSACETGIGELQHGEGIISLARGFTYAGAKSIVTSLWEVNDKATKIIMTDFYKNLKDGDDKATALQKAKMNYLNNDKIDPQYKHPFYWASFIAVGDMSPVDFGGGFNWWWVVGGFFVFFLIFFFRKK